MFQLSSWKPARLLAAWVVYWIGMAAVIVAPALPAAWKLMTTGTHGSTTVGIGDAGLSLSITANAVEVWSRSIPVWLLSFWIAVPPLMLWMGWLRSTRRASPRSRVNNGLAQP
jgi:hypothetical protein